LKKPLTKNYVEILGDTVSPYHTVLSVIISVGLGLGGFFIGKRLFSAANPQTAQSYALLLGIFGCVIALVITSLLFHPKRILSETMENALAEDFDVDLEEENEVIQRDPAIRKEMEELGIKDLLTRRGGSRR
jgi:uncharacterized membrane protein YeaQ/YmgE (transglycosylase-associated protein family)